MSSDYFNLDEKVEGARCEIFARRPDCKGLARNPHTHSRAWLCELSLNASIEVAATDEYTEEELSLRRALGVHFNVGDKLRADKITVYVECRAKPKFKPQEGMSATHGGNLCSTSSRTMGIIKAPFHCLQSKFQLLLPN